MSKTGRRLLIALIVAILLHLVFIYGIAPYLEFEHGRSSRTEVVQISPQQLNQLKQKIMKNKQLNPLLKQELREEFKSKEAPKDATMMAPFNQAVPKQQVAGPQADAPLDGGGSQTKQQANKIKVAKPPEKLNLAKLGLGHKIVPPPRAETLEDQIRERSQAGPPGPPGPFRPVGREDKNMERGDQNLLNAVESEFYSFFVRLEEPIIRNWYFLLRSHDARIHQEMASKGVKAGAELPVTIEFVLDRQGNFRSIEVIESSNVPTLDWATRESIKKLGALPNPPPGLFEGGQYYTRRLKFMVHVTEAPVMDSRPDLYW